MNADAWRRELDALNAACATRMELAVRGEFATLAADYPRFSRAETLIQRHRLRMEALLAAHMRATGVVFGAAAIAMLAPKLVRRVSAKAELPPGRAEIEQAKVRQAFELLARDVLPAALAQRAAKALAANRAASEMMRALISLHAGDVGAAVASARREQVLIAAVIDAASSQIIDAEYEVVEPSPSVGDGLPPQGGGAGGGAPPPPPPPAPPPPSGGSEPPRRAPRVSFGQRVEAHVRAWAPVRARRIAATSGHLISQVLAESAREGWSEERTAKALWRAFGGLGPPPRARLPFPDEAAVRASYARSGELSLARARVIARTEIGSAQNAATLAMAEARAERGEAIEKVWLTANDDRVRESHASAEGQSVALDQPFIVGEAALQHPGDPNGPLREIVSCRCGLLIRSAAGQSARAAAG